MVRITPLIIFTIAFFFSFLANGEEQACDQALTLKTWYPEIEPFERGHLKVSPKHTLYYEISGNPEGKPVVFLHGGPGNGSSPYMRQLFDPAVYKVILFDQRASGLSHYSDLLEGNNTQTLIQDMERLRSHLKITRWQVAGHSWGAYLGLVYAQDNPGRVSELLLASLLLPFENDPLYSESSTPAGKKVWQGFLSGLPKNLREDPLAAYYSLILGENLAQRRRASAYWLRYHVSLLNPSEPQPKLIADVAELDRLWPELALDVHYAYHRYFKTAQAVFSDVSKLRKIPTVIIQNEKDKVTPLEPVKELMKIWPEAKLLVIDSAEHGLDHPEFLNSFISSSDQFARQKSFMQPRKFSEYKSHLKNLLAKSQSTLSASEYTPLILEDISDGVAIEPNEIPEAVEVLRMAMANRQLYQSLQESYCLQEAGSCRPWSSVFGTIARTPAALGRTLMQLAPSTGLLN